MLFSDVHLSNALVYMYFNLLLSGILTVSSFVKLLKLFSPIDSSELGNVTLIAFLNILVNLSLIPVIPSSIPGTSDLYYSFEDGVLSIYGSGKVPANLSATWTNSKTVEFNPSEVTEIIIEEGIIQI